MDNDAPQPVSEPSGPAAPTSDQPVGLAPSSVSLPSDPPVEAPIEQPDPGTMPAIPPVPEEGTPPAAVVSAETAPPGPADPSIVPPPPVSPIAPPGITPELAALFQTWLTAYQKSLRGQGTQALIAKHQKHLDHVVELAAERGPISRLELQLAMRMCEAQIDRYLRALIAAGRLRKVGAGHKVRYEKA